MVVLAVLCVGSVSAIDYDNFTGDSQDMLATTDSIDVSQENIANDENNVLESSDDEVLGDYNYDNYDGKNYYYDDSISGTILNSASGSAVDGSSLSIGQTVHLSLGNEQINHDFGPDSKAYLRYDGDTNSENWEYIGTYQQLYTTGVDYTLKTGGSHYYQLLMNTFNNLENGAYTRFARGVYLENVMGPNIPSYSSDYYLSTDKPTVNLNDEFTITFKGNNGAFWGGNVDFYVNGKKIGTKTLGMFSESASITTTGTPVGSLTITAYFSGYNPYPEGWAKPVTVTVIGSGDDTPSKTDLKLYLNSNQELVYGQSGTIYKLYNTLTDENGNSVYNYLAHSSDGNVTEKITLYYNGGNQLGQISAGAEPEFKSGVNLAFGNYGIWVLNANYRGNNNGLTSADSNDVAIIYWDTTTTTHSLSSSSVDKGNIIVITPRVIANTINEETEDGQVSIYVDSELKATIDAGDSYNLDTSGLTVGSHNIYCVYNGYSEDYKQTTYELLKTSQSTQSSFTVKSTDVDTVTTISLNPKEVNIGEKVTITPTVTFEGNNLGVGDGKVAIYINGVKKGETDPGVGFDYTTESSGTFTVKAEYLGKDNYLKSNSSDDSFKVNKLNATLSVNPNNTNIELGSKITLTSTLNPDDATGTISYTSDDGQTGTGLSFDYTPTSEGTHTVTVFYEGNSKYNNITETIMVNVFKSSSSIKIDELITKVYGQSFTVNTTTVNSTGNIGVRLVNKNGNIEITGVTSQGNIVNIPIIDVGEYDLYVSTNPDSNHKSETAHATVIIIPKNSTISVESASGDWGSVIPVTVSLGEGSEAISTAKIYDASGNTFIKDATLNGNSVSVSGLAAGEYVIKVNNTVGLNYNSVYANATLTVNPVLSDVLFEDIAFVYGGSNSSSVSLVGAGDFVAVVVGQNAVISKESGKVTVSGLNVGTYDLNITTIPDENHTEVSKTHKVIVSAADSTFTVYPASGDWGSVIPVTVSLGDESKGISSAKIYDARGNTFIKDATLNGDSVSVSGLAAGEYVIKVTNVAKDNYESTTVEAKLTVNPVVSDVLFEDIAFVYGGSNSSSVSLVGAGDFVAFVVGQDAVISKESGKVTVSGLDVGTYDLNITTIPDENHTEVSKTHKITVLPAQSGVSSKDIEVIYDGKTISVDYTSNNAVNISYTVYENGKVVDKGNVKANEKIEVVSLPVGEYTINLKTVVDKNHLSVNETYRISVVKQSLDFSVTAIDATYPDSGKIEIKSNVDGEYLVEVNNKTYSVNVKDGVGSTSVDQLPANTYPVTVTSNISNYDNVTKNVSLIIKAKAKDIITLVEHYDVVKDYLIGDNYQVRVLLNGKSIGAGKVVTIITHGVTYKCKTDKNGYARLPINLIPGKYTITAEYAGIKVSNKILVKATLKAKSVTKKKAKKIKFKATLKTSKGKAIAGKKISFEIRGKIYIAKTNKKGVATVTFKNLKVGKYSIGVKYVHQIVKAKLKVRK